MNFGRNRFGGGSGGSHDRGGSGGGFRRQNSFVPVKEGEELDVRIEGVAEKGDGVAKKQGFVIFVPGTKLNDEVRIKVTKVARKVAFAEVIGQPQGPIESSSRKPETEEGEEGHVKRKKQEEDENIDTSNDSEEF
jgi:predicted RNA-binding protein with TRAM domain